MSLRLAVLAGVLAACGPEPVPFFPADFAAAWTEVRDCRTSIDHDLSYVLVHANDVAADGYADGVYPLAEGSILVKSLFADEACTEERTGFAAMKKQGDEWAWQRLDAERVVDVEADPAFCASCHQTCTLGRDMTCTDP